MATVRLNGMLREFAPRPYLEVDAPTLARLLDGLEGRYPRLRGRIRDGAGAVRRSVKVFVNGEELPWSGGMESPLSSGDLVEFIPSTPGG